MIFLIKTFVLVAVLKGSIMIHMDENRFLCNYQWKDTQHRGYLKR